MFLHSSIVKGKVSVAEPSVCLLRPKDVGGGDQGRSRKCETPSQVCQDGSQQMRRKLKLDAACFERSAVVCLLRRLLWHPTCRSWRPRDLTRRLGCCKASLMAAVGIACIRVVVLGQQQQSPRRTPRTTGMQTLIATTTHESIRCATRDN